LERKPLTNNIILFAIVGIITLTAKNAINHRRLILPLSLDFLAVVPGESDLHSLLAYSASGHVYLGKQ